jgi:hypothetical protein
MAQTEQPMPEQRLDLSLRPARGRWRTYATAAASFVVVAGAWAALRHSARERAEESASIARTLAELDKKIDQMTEKQQAAGRRLGALAAIVSAPPSGERGNPNASPDAADVASEPSPLDTEVSAEIVAEAEPPSPERVAADDAAREIVASALKARVWTESDRDRMRKALVRAGSETRTEVVRELAVAVNNGEVRVAVNGMPF